MRDREARHLTNRSHASQIHSAVLERSAGSLSAAREIQEDTQTTHLADQSHAAAYLPQYCSVPLGLSRRDIWMSSSTTAEACSVWSTDVLSSVSVRAWYPICSGKTGPKKIWVWANTRSRADMADRSSRLNASPINK